MSKRFLELYNQELRHVRETAAEFAAAYPKVARRLALDSGEVEDPYVERMLEGFAFLSGRVQSKIEAQFPRFTQHLLNIVYPHFGKPTPSVAIAQFVPSPIAGNLASGYKVGRHARMRANISSGEQTACEFLTAHDVEVWPLEVAEAHYLPHLADIPAHPEIRGRAEGGLRIVLKTTHGIPARSLDVDRLDFHFASPDDVAFRLFDLCIGHCHQVVLCDPARRDHHVMVVGAEQVEPLGFRDEESLLPFSARSFGGYRLLMEYFICPWRYLFVRLNGLREFMHGLSGGELEINILFSRADPGLTGAVKASDLALFCTPVVNLFERRFDRIGVSPELSEFHVVVDRQRPSDYEVFDIPEVEGYDHEQRELHSFRPFYQTHEQGMGPKSAAYFSFHREARVLSSVERSHGVRTGYAGSEVYLSLVDRDFAPFHVSLAQLGGSAWVTNRDLPMVMPIGRGSDFTLLDSVPIGAIRCLRGPTKPIAAVTGGAINWRLISHLSVNFLALDDLADGGAVIALRELLNLYAERGDGAYRGQVDSLQGVSTKQVVQRVPHEGPIIFGRGVEISVKLDEAAFAGASPFMLGMVLERFFARHVALNTFSETVLHSVSHGEIYRWPARIGDKPLI